MHSIPECKVGCYYCLFQQESLPETATLESETNVPEYVVCFLGGSEKGLELYPYLCHSMSAWRGRRWKNDTLFLTVFSLNSAHLCICSSMYVTENVKNKHMLKAQNVDLNWCILFSLRRYFQTWIGQIHSKSEAKPWLGGKV